MATSAVRAADESREPAVYTVREVAELLRVTPDTVRIWLADRRLRGIKLSDRRQQQWRIPRAEVDRLLAGEPER